MERNEYQANYELDNTYWWFVARRELISDILDEIAADHKFLLLLDAGCGTGTNSLVFSRYGQVIAFDLSEHALHFSSMNGVENLCRGTMTALPFKDETFDVIVALDVIEHVDDDLAALREYRRTLKKDGRIIITVPAHRFLWSEHDEALHHRRRYSGFELRNKLLASGFNIRRFSSFIFFLFLPIVLLRLWNGIFKKSISNKVKYIILPQTVNQALIWLMRVERFLLRWINIPLGVSLVAIAECNHDIHDETRIVP